jgi:hypothetical protein
LRSWGLGQANGECWYRQPYTRLGTMIHILLSYHR